MKITNFGRSEHRLLSAAIVEALAKVGADHGVTIKAAGGHFGTLTGDIKLNIEIVVAPGAQSKAERDFRVYAPVIGLRAEDWNQIFVSNNKVFRISGVKMGAPKYNMLATCVASGKDYKFVGERVATLIKRPAALAA